MFIIRRFIYNDLFNGYGKLKLKGKHKFICIGIYLQWLVR